MVRPGERPDRRFARARSPSLLGVRRSKTSDHRQASPSAATKKIAAAFVKYARIAAAPANSPHIGSRCARTKPYQPKTTNAAISDSMIAARSYIT